MTWPNSVETETQNLSTLVLSGAGFLNFIKGDGPKPTELRAKFVSSDSTLTTEELDQLMNDYLEATEAGNFIELGWPMIKPCPQRKQSSLQESQHV